MNVMGEPIVNTPEQAYFDSVHVRNRGNEIMANQIFDIVSPIDLQDIS
jgi:hypothetical protein